MIRDELKGKLLSLRTCGQILPLKNYQLFSPKKSKKFDEFVENKNFLKLYNKEVIKKNIYTGGIKYFSNTYERKFKRRGKSSFY